MYPFHPLMDADSLLSLQGNKNSYPLLGGEIVTPTMYLVPLKTRNMALGKTSSQTNCHPWLHRCPGHSSPLVHTITCPHHHLGLHYPPCTEGMSQPVHKIAARIVPSQCGRFMLIPFQSTLSSSTSGSRKGFRVPGSFGLGMMPARNHIPSLKSLFTG